ncbi:uncharacterized protein LOC106882204 isoform X1 [Octopus bimaculoides]|uniref:uncharacterized protein LOC106882204 isoform X1 n=1 Tax=Octopus bimaculoides TaxID=37653 RepID=UPI00071DCD11|nr:uncharacterized protein LOC106882204 isoform X1 [Octopus bimaculoides]XP_014788282.1 uncharacterized protein LOC106882204 isoform X1 [Octopus bimaculoides]|eukprot:XP_014788281.1 PREDICTED: uncharacterized protein LOC106882204 isoform X1 [Octopus bimaculoides]
MARHRSVRTMNYEDEFFDDDDVEDCYGQSFDDKYCISPGTVAQFTFPRKSNLDLGSYISSDSPSNVEPPIITPDSPKCSSKKVTYNSFDEARLNHCLDKIHEVLGDIHQDDILVECIKRHKYDTEAALNELLATPGAPKPQRQPREGRKSQDFPLCELDDSFCNQNYCTSPTDCNQFSDRNLQAFACRRMNSVGEEECSSYESAISDNFEVEIFQRKTSESEDSQEDQLVSLDQKMSKNSIQEENQEMEGDFETHTVGNSSPSLCQKLSTDSTPAAVSSVTKPKFKNGSNKQELMNLFEKAKKNKEQMEKDAKFSSVNKFGHSLSDGIEKNTWLGDSEDSFDIGDKPISLSSLIEQESGFKSSLADLNNQRHQKTNNDKQCIKDPPKDKGSCAETCPQETCKNCSKNRKFSPKNTDKTSLADLTKTRFNLDSDVSLFGTELVKKDIKLKTSQKQTQKLIQSSSDISKSSFAKTFDFSRPSKNKSTSKHLDSLKNTSEKNPLQNPKEIFSNINSSPPPQTVTGFSLCDLTNHKISTFPKKENGTTFPSHLNDSKYNLEVNEEEELKESLFKDDDCLDSALSLGSLISQVNLELSPKSDYIAENRLEDLCKRPKETKPSPESTPVHKTNNDNLSCSEKENNIYLTKEDPDMQIQKTAFKEPVSLFGKVISYRAQKYSSNSTKKLKYPKFSYKVQMNGISTDWESTLFHHITPFDFSTPSPDDIVKTRQKQAYHHRAPIAVEANS